METQQRSTRSPTGAGLRFPTAPSPLLRPAPCCPQPQLQQHAARTTARPCERALACSRAASFSPYLGRAMQSCRPWITWARAEACQVHLSNKVDILITGSMSMPVAAEAAALQGPIARLTFETQRSQRAGWRASGGRAPSSSTFKTRPPGTGSAPDVCWPHHACAGGA